MNSLQNIDYDIDPHNLEVVNEPKPAPPKYTAEDQRLDRLVRADPSVRRIETEMLRLKAELTSAQDAKSAANRAAFRDHLAGNELTEKVLEAGDTVALLNSLIAGAGQLYILEKYAAWLRLAAAADEEAALVPAQIETSTQRLDAAAKGHFDPDVPKFKWQHEQAGKLEEYRLAEANLRHQLGHHASTANIYRSHAANLKRGHAKLFAAEGV